MIETIFELLQKPYAQAALFILLTSLLVGVTRPENADSAWNTAGLVFIGFVFLNSIFIWSAPDYWKYFFYSLGFSVLYLVVISFIVPAIIKLLKVEGSGESAMVFLFIIYHPVLLLLVLFLKWVFFRVF